MLPPRFLAFELHRFPFEIHMVYTENVVDSTLIPDAVFCICHVRNCPAPAHRKIHLAVIDHHPGICIFIGRLATYRCVTGINIRPFIPVITDLIRNHRIFLKGNPHIQKCNLHQNASFRLPKSRERSVRTRAWWSASSRCSYR